MIAQGATAESSNAAGSRNNILFLSEPRAMRPMIGNSRSAAKPTTYRGVTAASSITTPTAFALAFAVCVAASSSEAAATFARATTSSRSARSPLVIPLRLPIFFAASVASLIYVDYLIPTGPIPHRPLFPERTARYHKHTGQAGGAYTWISLVFLFKSWQVHLVVVRQAPRPSNIRSARWATRLRAQSAAASWAN